MRKRFICLLVTFCLTAALCACVPASAATIDFCVVNFSFLDEYIFAYPCEKIPIRISLENPVGLASVTAMIYPMESREPCRTIALAEEMLAAELNNAELFVDTDGLAPNRYTLRLCVKPVAESESSVLYVNYPSQDFAIVQKHANTDSKASLSHALFAGIFASFAEHVSAYRNGYNHMPYSAQAAVRFPPTTGSKPSGIARICMLHP